ncbi:tetratricopeptide repeat protein [Luteimonas viscosa]|uniref:Tetratricopeptide repeat protein 38 n=1 Tax=Luteimonas viscosa TaxID=1132694 RepID=A0A5D4XLJ8_9GAMM|nr:tetratricopeptide repeat protein [Luteimonas viscosa]TYT25526.1 tetratricopeptide repeat protein [Luteimonas viscosa]
MHYPHLAARGAIAGLLSQSLESFLGFFGDPLAPLAQAMELDPDLAEARVLRAWMLMTAGDASLVPMAREDVAVARRSAAGTRLSLHLDALERWCGGDWRGAARAVEDINLQFPHDVLALLVGHFLDYYVGDARTQLVRTERAIAQWDPQRPGWHAVLGMYAFGLEENARYREAERFGRMAVEVEPRNAWAQHAVAHVLEMQGRPRDGIAWMESNPHWQADSGLSPHNWWHLALFHMALGDLERIVALYDGPITDGVEPRPLPLHDASSMLWRLRLRGQPLGDRWNELADRWAPYADEQWSAFNDWHALMAFVGAGRGDLVERKLRAQADAQARGDYRTGLADAGHAVCRAIVAHGNDDHRRVVELLRPIRGQTHRMGGSVAQRDLVELTLMDSARRSGQRMLADALEAERHNAMQWRAAA